MVAYDPDSEVDGKYLVALVESAGEVSPIFERRVRGTFEEHMSEVEPDEWYRTAELATAFEEIQAEVGEKTIRKGGREAAKVISWPDDISAIEDALEFLRQAQRDAFRNSPMTDPAGNYTFERMSSRSFRVATTEGYPVPPAWAEGVFVQIAEQFGPEDANPMLREASPREDESNAWELYW